MDDDVNDDVNDDDYESSSKKKNSGIKPSRDDVENEKFCFDARFVVIRRLKR